MALFRSLIIICAILPFSLEQCTLSTASSQLKRSVYEFSANLAARLALEKDNHFISSTLSTWALISLMSIGATDSTFDDIQDVLKLQPHQCFHKKYWELVKTVLNTNDPTLTFKRTSLLVMDEKVEINDLFMRQFQKAGLCEIRTENFEESIASTSELNTYVLQTTNDRIEDIVVQNDFALMSLVVIDALFVEATLTHPFGTAVMETSPFYDEVGNEVGMVNMLETTSIFNFTVMDQIQARVLQIPNGAKQEYSTLIFLPYDQVLLSTVLQNLSFFNLKTVFRQFEKVGPREINVQMPKINMTSDLDNLEELLGDMGLSSMFDASAKYSRITNGDSLYVSNFIQKVSIEINGRGTTEYDDAGGITGHSGNEFILNKPFFFMMVDNAKELPVLVGAYSKPSVVL